MNDAKMPIWALPLFSWLISFYFLLGFSTDLGFPPSHNISKGHAIFVALWLFFLFLPFFNKIKIGKFLELEREIEKTKTEVKELKEELRFNLSMVTTSINTMGNLSNQVTVNLPGVTALEEDKRNLDKNSPNTKDEAEVIRNELNVEGEDTVMALARTRIRIEHLLRKILANHPATLAYYSKPAKYLSINKLFQAFLKVYEAYSNLENPFTNVLDVCNAAMHAQYVSQAQADEALEIGARIIAILSDICAPEMQCRDDPM